MTDYVGIGGSDLFSFDNTAALESNILYDDTIQSKVEYDEYAVYRQPDNAHLAPHSPYEGSHVTHKISHDDKEGAEMLEKAFRQGHLVSYDGNFVSPGPEASAHLDLLEGRVRRVVCFRRAKSKDGSQDGLSLDIEDFEILKLHPATLGYSRRTTTESRFWSKDGTQLSIVLSFSSNAKTPYDFLSMTYNINTRCSTILIRQSYHPRRHRLENLDEYDHRMEACRAHWSHPFVTPVVLLQVHFMRTEEAVAANNHNVTALEKRVSDIAGFEATAATEKKMSRKHHWYRRGDGEEEEEEEEEEEDTPTPGIMSMTNLMKRAHEVLKESIELMDALRWTERAVKVLMIAGDELVERTTPASGPFGFGMTPVGPRSAHPNEDQDAPPRTPIFPDEPVSLDAPRVFLPPMSNGLPEHLGSHWHDIRQYLESLLRICMSLETERRMSEARCRAQIDIIYSKMAQEDNVLNARMAVASTRDSSSMKALAVITAIFLPGEFLGTLFGMSMFDWMAAEDEPPDGAPAASVPPGTSTIVIDDGDKVLSGKFYIYWCFAIPLTIIILSVWRGWWVTEDRYFRRHLSKELSEERYWTVDGKPRVLEKSFAYDFFRLSARWDETQPRQRRKSKGGKEGRKGKDKEKEGKMVNWSHFANTSFLERPDRGEQKDVESLRHMRALFARRESILRRRPSEVV